MKALIQRVQTASVRVDESVVGEIEKGLLVFLAAEKGDDLETVDKLADRLLNYRVFSDQDGKMNLSSVDTGAEILLVSQFTLAADTRKGRRPSFTPAAAPELAKELYLKFAERLRQAELKVETGQFAADMQVGLVNDGPVTFMLEQEGSGREN